MKLSRRDFLKAAGLTGLSVASLAALSACSDNEKKPGPTGTDAPGSTGSDSPTAHPDEWDIAAEGCFRSSRPENVDEIPSGFTTSKDRLIIRLDQDSGSLDPLQGGVYAQPSAIFCLCGTSMLAAGYVDGGIDFQINQYTLCDSMTWDDDMLGVTFHVRDNAYFHNGDPVLASDAVFSIKRFKENVRFSYIDFENIVAKDDKTLYIPLNRGDGNFLFIMGIFCRVFSERAYNEAVASGAEADFFYSSEGTCGMYEIEEWVAGDHVTLKADPNFYKPALIDTITFRFIADNTVAMMELETGGIDVLYTPSSSDVVNVLGGQYGDSISGIEDPGDTMTIMGFNIAGSFSDLNLRYAVVHAVDWSTIVKTVWGELGSAPTTILASTLYGLNDTADWWKGMYDVEKAKEYLSKTKYPDGLELTLLITNTATVVAASEMLAKYLGEIGIKLHIETYDTATQGSMMNDTEGWDLWIRDWGGYGMTWGSNFIEGGTYDAVCHPAVTEPDHAKEMYDLGVKLSSTLDREQFKAVANELQDGYLDGKFFYFFPITQVKAVTLGTAQFHNWYRCKDNLYIADAYFE